MSDPASIDSKLSSLARQPFRRASTCAAGTPRRWSSAAWRSSAGTPASFWPSGSRRRADKDGKQTPYRGHPVFVAQHATATCCRSCLERWHGIPKGRELSTDEQAYAVDVICRWIETDLAASGRRAPR